MSALRVAGTIATIVSIDAAGVYAAAFLLWSMAGTTMVNGPIHGLAACLVVSALGMTLRRIVERSRPDARAGDRTDATAMALRVVALAGVLFAWLTTGLYFLGWLACFAGSMLTIGSLIAFLGELVDSRYRAGAGRGSSRRRQRRATTKLAGVLAGAAAMVVVAPVHVWDAQLLGALVLLNGAAVLLAALASHLLSALGRSRRTA
ncbi:hypothetical protein [Microbacterium sp. NPDC089695]|uniref:hypothetical protein n=1 Tax=Microbacterium sp. NPDC089695 TaxID=3364198 RepID=UPI00381908E9